MKPPRRAPISPTDKNVFEFLSKNIGRHAAAAANLPEDSLPFFRHASESCAKMFGSTSRQRLFAEVQSCPPVFEKGLTRQAVRRQFESVIKNGVSKLEADGMIDSDQARAIADAAPTIVRAVATDLQYLEVDRHTFERRELDPRLLAARAPKFEYAVTKDHPVVFDFERARQGLRDAAGAENIDALNKVTPDRITDIVRSSVLSPVEAVKQGVLPLTHIPIVLTDEAGDVVGVSLQHPIHRGVLPVCCEDQTRFWAVAAALYTGVPAQSQYGDNWSLSYVDPTNIRQYYPVGLFGASFNQTKDDDGAAAYYVQVDLATAIAYLTALSKAVNDQRVHCKEPDRRRLNSASLSSVISASPKSGTYRTYWGLMSFQSQPGQSKVMSWAGTTKGDVGNQWYLRQDYWLEEKDVRELDMPSDHFLAPRQHVDVTKIIPEGIEDFTQRALEHATQLSKEKKGNSAIDGVVAQLKEQKKRLQRVKEALEGEAVAATKARQAGLAAVGPEIPPPV